MMKLSKYLYTPILLVVASVATSLSAQRSDANYALGNDSATVTEKIEFDSLSIYDATLDSLVHDFYLQRAFVSDCVAKSDTVVTCPDSVYIARLQALPYEMQMPYNSIVKGYIEMYAKRRTQVGHMLALGKNYYFSIFEQMLERYHVPLELKYLPIIESALNARAVSPAGAAGLWQFMVPTGRIYDLEVNSLVDERRDPRKSSEAAARYLSDLYKLYDDWHLVIAAYNCGPGNVAKAIRYAGGKRDYWAIYPYLPRETRGYVPIFIAANYIMNYYQEHDICPSTSVYNYPTDTIMIMDRVHFTQIAEKIDVSVEELKFLNPQYRRDIVPGNIKPYPLVLPLDQINQYALNRDSILAHAPELIARQLQVEPSGYDYSNSSGGVKYYRVRSGDTLGHIAKKYRVSVSQLKRWNGLRSTMIRVGQRLKIYK